MRIPKQVPTIPVPTLPKIPGRPWGLTAFLWAFWLSVYNYFFLKATAVWSHRVNWAITLIAGCLIFAAVRYYGFRDRRSD
jgi:hypothetical protein